MRCQQNLNVDIVMTEYLIKNPHMLKRAVLLWIEKREFQLMKSRALEKYEKFKRALALLFFFDSRVGHA